MKYCMKCGTLLEDSHERCIGCGADMSEPGSWSLYPPEMTESIEAEKRENNSKRNLIVAMIIVFVLLVAIIVAFIISTSLNSPAEEPETQVEELAAEVEEEPVEEVVEVVEPEVVEEEPAPAAREVKDADGKYYNYGTLLDAAGKTVFTTVYPEDFIEVGSAINYDIYSTKYPESLTYVVGNEDGNVRMTYMSPQHYFYRRSDNKKTRNNERDIYYYMQFYTYKGAQGYIEAMIKDSYTDIKGFKLIDKEEYSPIASEKLKEVSDARTTFLTGDIGDYGFIGQDTVYAAMAAECEAYIYHYEATSRQNNTIYMDFYVPVVANMLNYASVIANDKGDLTEWIIPEFVAFEAGNEELYNLYKDDYKLFIANSRPTEEFFYMNKTFGDELAAEIKDKGDMSASDLNLDTKKMEEIHGKFKKGTDLGEFAGGIYQFVYTQPEANVTFMGDGDTEGMSVTGLENASVAFLSLEKNKVFISPTADEYPGDAYAELISKSPRTADAGAEDAAGAEGEAEAAE